MLLISSMTLSCIFIFLSHPMTMGMILLAQTILIALITGFMNINFWFSYILFLILIGGMLVLFIYMTSIASNEKFKFSSKIFYFLTLAFITNMVINFNIDSMFYSIINFNLETLNNNYMFNLTLTKYLNFPSNILLFMMIIYLFITLIAVVKITNINYGPLRQKF